MRQSILIPHYELYLFHCFEKPVPISRLLTDIQ